MSDICGEQSIFIGEYLSTALKQPTSEATHAKLMELFGSSFRRVLASELEEDIVEFAEAFTTILEYKRIPTLEGRSDALDGACEFFGLPIAWLS